jgi:predicted nuclease with TOPRIM domain
MPLLLQIFGALVALVTVTASLAAVWRVGRLRSAAETAERAALAWQEERNAAIAKAERQDAEILELKDRVKELETEAQRLRERTDLTRYFDAQDVNHHQVVDELHGVAGSVKSLATAMETLAAMIRPLTAAQ